MTKSDHGPYSIPSMSSLVAFESSARVIAYYRVPDPDRALTALDALLADHPDDPWFHELKGRVLFENGRFRGAIAHFQFSAPLSLDVNMT